MDTKADRLQIEQHTNDWPDYEGEAIRRAIKAHQARRPGHQVIGDINVTCDVICLTCGKHGRWFGSAVSGIGYGISTLHGWSKSTRPEDF